MDVQQILENLKQAGPWHEHNKAVFILVSVQGVDIGCKNDLQPWQNCRRKFGGNDGGRQSALQSNNSKNVIHSQSFLLYQGKLITKLLYD